MTAKMYKVGVDTFEYGASSSCFFDMSVRAETPAVNSASSTLAVVEAAQAVDSAAAEGNSFNVASEQHPLQRNVVVSIQASLNELCLQKSRGTWAPSQEALRAVFQQQKFTSLDGSAEPMGDLKVNAA